MLYMLIVRPVRRVVACGADRLSLGNTSSADREIPELPEGARTNWRCSARAPSYRMRRNLEDTIKAMDKR